MNKINLFRVYFECLEQAEHFGINAIRSATKQQSEVQLIRLPSSAVRGSLANSLLSGLEMKNPDLVLSAIINGQEIPLVWIEISTAVLTEDHIQQRFDSVVAASKLNVVFVKIESPRVSPSDHGGNVSFDQSEMFKLGHQKLGVYGFHIVWPTTSDGLRSIRSLTRVSCPETTLGIEDILRALIQIVEHHGKLVTSALEASDAMPAWAREQIRIQKLQLSPLAAPRSTRFFRNGSDWVLKFNRWGHAMDPERGMSWYNRYRVGNPLIGKIHDPVAINRESAIENFARATGIVFESATSSHSFTVDITDNIKRSDVNRSGLAIISNCREFTVCKDDGSPLVRFVWSHATTPSQVTRNSSSVVMLSNLINEDEVTYAASHRFAGHLSLIVQSVSYPGAQGDFALLEGSGRSTKRTYVDLIAVDNLNSPSRILLIESKGNRIKSNIEADAEKVVEWRDQIEKHKNLLSRLGAHHSASVMVGCAYPGERFLDVNILEKHGLDFELVVARNRVLVRNRDNKDNPLLLNFDLPTQFELVRNA